MPPLVVSRFLDQPTGKPITEVMTAVESCREFPAKLNDLWIVFATEACS